MKVVWTRKALQDRAAIWDHIAVDSPKAAACMDERFSIAAELLSQHPLLGHAGQIPQTRELFPHKSYRLVYETAADQVLILAIVHTSRLWPPAI